jgi:hypothetical protein
LPQDEQRLSLGECAWAVRKEVRNPKNMKEKVPRMEEYRTAVITEKGP